jgi:hypothetical protein
LDGSHGLFYTTPWSMQRRFRNINKKAERERCHVILRPGQRPQTQEVPTARAGSGHAAARGANLLG